MAKVVIQLEGGLVQGVYLLQNKLFSGSKIDGVVVVDFDTEGADSDEITSTQDKNGALLEAVVHAETIDPLPKGSDVHRVAVAYLEAPVVADTVSKDLPILVGCLEDPEAQRLLSERLKEEGEDDSQRIGGIE